MDPRNPKRPEGPEGDNWASCRSCGRGANKAKDIRHRAGCGAIPKAVLAEALDLARR